ncbi:plasmid partitioning protein RepB [Pseudooceanicola nanhaiensis]|uniref:plasmid partitioning protein RepB n=1 Tax=Pseudooceanicola nanhaiensis TaxID=375761 RepID=UPI001CD6DE69|nr:plasmid partitioning protein RepB [Pseudooceanicola nanhaiensis]MCA0922932.1 plasmid partitioning protein RepB [Pseudooceanicola nanhaiensis]
MARKGILTSNITPPSEAPSRQRTAPQGAVGALQSSLTKLQESAVQDIDTALIDNAGMEDRLGLDAADQARLIESLQTYGQQVPVLLRPHPKVRGRYEIVYGRRRLAALRKLGLPVKAMVRQLDDHALVMAQGQENNARTDLSFIEKASFAAQLQDAGYDRPTIAAALSIDLPMVSRLLKVGQAFDLDFLRQVGRAPAIGRERWMTLVTLFQDPAAHARASNFLRRPEFVQLSTNERFEAVLRAAQKTAAPAPKPTARKSSLSTPAGAPLAEMKATDRSVSLTVKPGKPEAGFNRWIEENAEDLLNEWFARWQSEQATENDA